MKKIDFLSIEKLRNDEAFGLLQRVLNLGTAILTQEVDVPILAAYKAAVDEFDAALKQDVKFKDTKTVDLADALVDEIYRGFRLYIRGMQLHPDMAKRAEADSVLAIIDKYGDVVNLPYNQQYGALHNSMQELTALPAEMQTSLGLTPWLEGLTLAIAKFQSAREALTAEKGAYQAGLSKETRIAAEKAYRTFVKSVNVFAAAFGEANYATFIDQVNSMIADAKAVLKSRATRAENQKNEENGTGTEDSEGTEGSESTEDTGTSTGTEGTEGTGSTEGTEGTEA